MVMALPCGHNVLIVTFAIINVVVLQLCLFLCLSSVFVLVVVLIIVFLL